ncbi:MAG: lipoprotein-releasing ABC transporter permease subunit [Beijerinckiaceae bacterium]
MTAPAPPLSATKPFESFEWMIAGRYLRARRKEGFISVIAIFSFIGVMLGVATLIVVMSVMSGFRKELLSKIIGVNGHAYVAPIEQALTDFKEVSDRIGKVPGVTLSMPMIEGQAFASSANSQSGGGVIVRGVRESDIKKIKFIADNIKSGSLDGFDVEKGIAVGKRLADQLGVHAGDTVTLISPKGASTPFGLAPRVKGYPVQAIFEIGMSEYDAAFVYMPLDEAQLYFNKEDDVTGIEIFVENPDRMDDYRGKIEEALKRPGFVSDWRQRNRSFFSALEVERNLQFIILSLIVLVAALNIISGLIMLVKDKASDIAILRTMGATRGAVMRVFLITGASIGVTGTLAGMILGLVFCWNIQAIQTFLSRSMGTQLWDPTVRFLTQVPAVIDPKEVFTIVLMALILSLLATLYPSWKAAKTDPVEALRYG